MKACRTNAADDALAAADADDEPVFRPLRRNNWTAFRKRGRRAAPDETARSAEEELNVAVISLPPSDGGCENEAFDATAAVQGSEEGPSQRALPPQRDANVGDDSEPPTYATALLMTSRALDLPCVCCCPVASPRGDAANHGGERGGVRPVPPESRDAREAPIREDAVGVSGVASSSSVAGRPAGPGIRAATLARHRNDVVVGATRLEPGPAPPPHHEVLPDILNAHLPPPYATLPPPPSSSARRHLPPPPRLRPPRCVVDTEVVEPKHCCGVLVTQTVSIRWFIVMIAFVGLCCAIVGTVLGALKATGREHLTVSLLMIGVGIVLITVSGIAWRLTSHEAPSCRAMLGLRGDEPGGRRFVPRVPPYGGRPGGHPYAAMLYPEFQYRPPPPSYQASMQEYRLRLLLLDRQGGPPTLPTPVALAAHHHHHHHHHAVPAPPPVVPPPAAVTSQPAPMLSPVSPPPTYRSGLHARPPLSFPSADREPSRPPSYRSRTSSAAGGGILRSCVGGNASCSQDTLATVSPAEDEDRRPLHSRNPSLTLSTLSQEEASPAGATASSQHAAADTLRRSYNASVLGVSGSLSSSNRDTPSPPPGSSSRAPDPHLLRKNHDVNTVTIVQTTDTSQVINQDTVIVSVSGHNARTLVLPSGHSEVQVTLAHV
ncbi:uncharacterized protein LOC119453852 isoform X1 [Dermacentor silvarum]|uniref:uncharacterized protein LOC119453852 isoform X1 n=1 Tax=Dermacentor silvarum TaxID=543639 RepID=UPI00210121DD|nr:uncharacterized protein LOC119453852 isoform X1 [Dermacentor silvarum]